MDGHVESKTPHDRSLIALIKSSPSSSLTSSSSSSSSSTSSWAAEKNALLSSCPVRTGSKAPPHEQEQQQPHVAEIEAVQRRVFIDDIVGHSGMEWNDVENRFNQLASTGTGPEPVVKWSEFGSCIGENRKVIHFMYHLITLFS